MKKNKINSVLCGTAIGFVNGLFGGGGGMIAVPLMSKLLGYTKKQAHATAIFVIAPICLASAITYVAHGFVDLSVLIPATLGNVAGGLIGANCLGKLPLKSVEIIFVFVMFAAGIRMIIG